MGNTKRLVVSVPYTRARSYAYMVWLDPDTGRHPWKVWRLKPGPKREIDSHFGPTAPQTKAQAMAAIQESIKKD